MTFLEMQTEVQEYLGNRGDLTLNAIKRQLNRALRNICNTYDFYENEKTDTITTVLGTYNYSLFSDAREIVAVSNTTTVGTEPLNSQDISWWVEQEYSGSSAVKGVPCDYVRYGDELYLFPLPDGVYVHDVYYIKAPPELVDDSDIHELPEDWDQVLVLFAASAFCFKYSLDTKGMNLKNEALGYITGIVEDRTRDKRWDRSSQVRVQRTRRG